VWRLRRIATIVAFCSGWGGVIKASTHLGGNLPNLLRLQDKNVPPCVGLRIK